MKNETLLNSGSRSRNCRRDGRGADDRARRGGDTRVARHSGGRRSGTGGAGARRGGGGSGDQSSLSHAIAPDRRRTALDIRPSMDSEKQFFARVGTRRCTTRTSSTTRRGSPLSRHPEEHPSTATRSPLPSRVYSSRASKSSSSFSPSGPAQHRLAISALVASLTVVAVAAAGVLIHRPLSRVPENTLKFIVGILLTSFGMFWSAEGAGVAWPGGESAIPVLIALSPVQARCFAGALRRQHRRILAPQVPS